MAREESKLPKDSGRRKLQGALDELIQQSKEEKVLEDPAIEEAAKSLVELPNSIKAEDLPGLRKKGLGSPRKRRRRRKKEHIPASDAESDSDHGGDGGRHIPHVMTLYDRRVDLARFSDATPLYVMCREWMRNKPEKRRSRSVSTECTATVSESLQRFLGPQSIPEDQRLDIPEPTPPHNTSESLDRHLEQQSSAVNQNGEDSGHSVDALKSQHLQRWRDIKTRWKRSSLADQQRYSTSLRMLRDMFQR